MSQPAYEEQPECANCGLTGDLLRCSRCRNEWFCSVACQKSYWPFHRDYCKKNEFADALEATEPKMAAWMRKHGKLAVLKDDEVERLERAGKAACSAMSREQVLGSMYGRLDPKPLPPTYSLEDKLAVDARHKMEQQQMHTSSSQDREWAALTIPEGLGLECGRYKWRQTQSHVQVYCLVPPGVAGKKVRVVLEPRQLSICLGADPGLWWIRGELSQGIRVKQSTWFVADGVLQISLLKSNRKGHYKAGGTNADTWWRSLMVKAGPQEIIPRSFPPTRYYWTEYDEDDLAVAEPQPPETSLLDG